MITSYRILNSFVQPTLWKSLHGLIKRFILIFSLAFVTAALASNWRSLPVEATSLKPISRLRSSRIFQQVWGGFFDSHFGSEMTKTHAESEACLCRFFNGLWDTWFRTRNSVSAPWYTHSEKVLFYRFSVPKADSSREKSLQTFWGKRFHKLFYSGCLTGT